ncbi:MAG: ester cyclase [Pyrinomonadaceae bacterium]|nr:ester cyclase [Pyrinomonadaceae bacterium]
MSASVDREQLEARLRLAEEHIAAENAFDIERTMATYGRNPAIVFNGVTINGHEKIRALYEELGFGGRGAFSNVSQEVNHRYVTDEAVILELTVTGEHTGTWQGIAATGRKIEFPVCAIFVFDEEGKAASERVYFDGSLLLKQLGVLP